MTKRKLISRREMLKGAGQGLIRRKYSDADIEGILGGNFERVLAQIWTVGA